MLGMSIAFALIWGYAAWTPGLLNAQISSLDARASLPRFAIGVAIYAVTIAVAFLSAALCLAIHALLALYYVFDQTTTQQTESTFEAGHRADERTSKETG
jgi:ABC-type transport system involved in cytochrome bd biosynthesis fused ATPase/permease subunit